MKESISETFINSTPEQRAKFIIQDGKVLQRKPPEKRMSFTRQQLIDFLVVSKIKTIRGLAKSRVPEQDPNFHHYRREFKTWNEAVKAAFGKDAVVKKPQKTGQYIIDMMVRYQLYKCADYKKFKKQNPYLLPCYDSLIKEFSHFKLAVKIARYHSLQDTANEYLKLQRKLGKKPTFEDCRANGIDLTRLLRFFKKKANFDDFIDEIEHVRIKQKT